MSEGVQVQEWIGRLTIRGEVDVMAVNSARKKTFRKSLKNSRECKSLTVGTLWRKS